MAACIERLTGLHTRLCPRQVLGVRIGLYASELLQLELPRDDKRVLVMVETDGCFADGVSTATGCWFGHRTLRLVDHGKVAATVVDTLSGQAVRIRPRAQARILAEHFAPHAANRWLAQLRGYQVMPAQQLLDWQWVSLDEPVEAIVGAPGRTLCLLCDEEILNGREVRLPVGVLCRSCAGDRYCVPVGAALAAPTHTG
jgi:formylmethanofuran dehydrogenase subunit E